MEIHSVLPEERARDAKGVPLPWGYRYPESSRGVKQTEETGAFGRHRSMRASGSRSSRSRAGTTPVRQKENAAVADFGKIFAKEQASQPDSSAAPGAASEAVRPSEPDAIPTECLLYGYASKSVEWKVISKYERIVAPSIICEDYPREDPNLFLNTSSPMGYSRSSVVVHNSLSKEALKKSRVYKGGKHWIKITFDSYPAAERACFYSPIEVDGFMVHCEMWTGRGPTADIPLPKGSETANLLSRTPSKGRTMPSSKSSQFLSGKQSAISGFERVMSTLPRSHTMPDVQYGQPEQSQDDISLDSTTASSATATGHDSLAPQTPNLRSRSIPNLPSQTTPAAQMISPSRSTYMTAIPSAKRMKVRDISEALPSQPSFMERVLSSLPIINWFIGSKGGAGQVISDGPVLKDDGAWDYEKNGWYWGFWKGVDSVLGTDFCGVKDE